MIDASKTRWLDMMGMAVSDPDHQDVHEAFRGAFRSTAGTRARIDVFSTCPFLIYLDGALIGEGPMRWADTQPEYQSFEVKLKTGDHVVAIHAHYEGVETRLLRIQPGFLACRVEQSESFQTIEWKSTPLRGYSSKVKRINPELGWMEWCDTRQHPSDWISVKSGGSDWAPVKAQAWVGIAPRQSEIKLAVSLPFEAKILAKGEFTEVFGYDNDEPNAQFFLRDLAAHHGPPQGVWRRFDLGKVRLMRPKFTIEAPAGAIVTFAYSENLVHGRVSPWITLSAGPSSNLDRYVARGGVQEFHPMTPKGGRYVEVHVTADPKKVRFVEEKFVDRTYHGSPQGAFHSSDARLNEIFATGIHTYASCSEDSVIDNPTRERGEWIGDTLSIGLENAGAVFSDLKLFRNALRHAAYCSRSDGLVAGLCPGTVGYLSTYACHWMNAAVRLWEMTGDRDFLRELFPFARKNMVAFSTHLTDAGLEGDLGWAFIDWGYVGNEGSSDMGLNLIYLSALRSMIRWCSALGEPTSEYEAAESRLKHAILTYFSTNAHRPEKVGLQRVVLALRSGLVPTVHQPNWVQFVKKHYLSCFPNDQFAPHLADPGTAQPRLITPFFSHFALSVLWEHGEGEFVLNQYRTCWGWALDQGLTTWPEVFDLRWSHCHQWSGCPTWQMSRYVLGLSPRRDLEANTFEFRPHVTSLEKVQGKIPIAGSTYVIHVDVHRTSMQSHWHIQSEIPIRLLFDGKLSEPLTKFEHSVTLKD